MRRAPIIAVSICTFLGFALIFAPLELVSEKGAGMSGETKAVLLIIASIGLLIGTVGLGVFAIVEAIRSQPHQR